VGGVGSSYIQGCATENIVALCDVDSQLAAKVYAQYPGAARYTDYRAMFDHEKGIDAVIVATPDHTHAEIALAAMALGKHVYCAKPLTRTIAEARRMATTARQSKVATQMSVQSSMSKESCETVDWIRAGAVGRVHEVHVWSDRPVWPQSLGRPPEKPPVPETLDWKGWLGSAPHRPYHPVYHPFNWRGWVDFGTGALGDMGCHTLHVIVRALDLGLPVSVSASVPVQFLPAYGEDRDMNWIRGKRAKFEETFPAASIVTWQFDSIRVSWYDGGLRPPRPAEWPAEQKMGADGILFVGERGVLHSGFTGGPKLVSAKRRGSYTPPKAKLTPVEDHYQEWIAACKGGPAASCEFSFGALLTEICLLGVLAQRLPGRVITREQAPAIELELEAGRAAS
jgi:predicted dehydrogenase